MITVNIVTLSPSSGRSSATTKAKERPTAPLKPPHVINSTVLPENPYPKCVKIGLRPSILTSLLEKVASTYRISLHRLPWQTLLC